MDRKAKVKIGAGLVVSLALVVALGAAGAIAASRALSPSEERKAVIQDAATQLGVEASELSDALKQALENRVDEAVQDGRLTEEQGKMLKERIDSDEAPLVGGFGGHRFGHFGKLDAAASYLGLTEAELRNQLESGKTLADVAKAENKSVDALVQALVVDAEKMIDEAVAGGRLTAERAAEMKESLTERMTEVVNGEHRGPGFGRGHGFGHGFGHGDGSSFRGSLGQPERADA